MNIEDVGTENDEVSIIRSMSVVKPDSLLDLVTAVQSTKEWNVNSGTPATIYGFTMEDLRYLRRIIDSAGLRLPLTSNIVE